MAACRVLDEPIRLTAQYGQMGIEDVWDDGTDELVTRYGIGARGIEVISLLPLSANASCRGEGAGGGASESFGFPLYDIHGNMVATLGRSGSSFTLGNEQSYDVWGAVRSGSSSEEQGYVANLGHRADPESFLTYMRARYYEPHTGRFISEDPKSDGMNWFTYCRNMPTVYSDESGESVRSAYESWRMVMMLISVWILSQLVKTGGDIGAVESAYGKLVGYYERDFLSDVLHLPEPLVDAIHLIEYGMAWVDAAKTMLNGIVITIYTPLKAAALTSWIAASWNLLPKDFIVLMVGYGIRLEGYLNSID